MIGTDRRFGRLKKKFQRFALLSIAVFFGWYFLYVAMSAFARDFMGQKLIGNINVALAFGILQFVSTFVITWAYARYARNELDPLAERVREELDHLAYGPPRRSPNGVYRPAATPPPDPIGLVPPQERAAPGGGGRHVKAQERDR